ncbi:hypothetical protein F511_04504 [Dorcoceras hygrometricum]|uniref:Uncharacterized protein n=1 Tax=Dorcoceras hygrometricum TaxID=472368 RepID=A0A2Z7C8P9_9LAMI|nr:hypothetical protein F511_04504 [Dorcoceras hygrometricum]
MIVEPGPFLLFSATMVRQFGMLLDPGDRGLVSTGCHQIGRSGALTLRYDTSEYKQIGSSGENAMGYHYVWSLGEYNSGSGGRMIGSKSDGPGNRITKQIGVQKGGVE